MWTLTAVSRLATCACLAVSVFPGRLIHLPRLAPRVTLAVRADAKAVIYLSICWSIYGIPGVPGAGRVLRDAGCEFLLRDARGGAPQLARGGPCTDTQRAREAAPACLHCTGTPPVQPPHTGQVLVLVLP